jgi:hypothetical protein
MFSSRIQLQPTSPGPPTSSWGKTWQISNSSVRC